MSSEANWKSKACYRGRDILNIYLWRIFVILRQSEELPPILKVIKQNTENQIKKLNGNLSSYITCNMTGKDFRRIWRRRKADLIQKK